MLACHTLGGNIHLSWTMFQLLQDVAHIYAYVYIVYAAGSVAVFIGLEASQPSRTAGPGFLYVSDNAIWPRV